MRLAAPREPHGWERSRSLKEREVLFPEDGGKFVGKIKTVNNN